MCRNHGSAIAYFVQNLCGQKVHQKLNGKIKGYQQRDLRQRYSKFILKFYKKQRRKIVYDCLNYVRTKAGVNC